MAKMEDKGVQTDITSASYDRRKGTVELPRWVVGSTAVLAVLVAVWCGYQPALEMMNLGGRFTVGTDLLEDMGVEGVMLFRQHDRDDDGVLSMQEFEPLVHRILETNVSASRSSRRAPPPPPSPGY